LGIKKKTLRFGDLPYIISDVLETPQEKTFKLKSCNIVTSMELKPIAVVKLLYKDKENDKELQLEESAQGDGGYDAFMNAIRKLQKSKLSTA